MTDSDREPESRTRDLRFALRDAQRYIKYLESENDLLRIELACRVKEGASMRTEAACVSAAKRACEEIGCDYMALTEVNHAGNVYRDAEAIKLRAAVSRRLRSRSGWNYAPFSSWDIARALNLKSHASVLESKALRIAKEGAWVKPKTQS